MLICLLAFAFAAPALWAWRRHARRVGRRERMLAETFEMAARAQTWWRSPRVLGGADRRSGYRGLSFRALGLASDSQGRSWTETGVYRALPVPAGARLAQHAAAFGMDAPVGGALVLGCERGCDSSTAVAVLVIDGLMAIPLPTVPWGWVASLVRRATRPVRAERQRLPRLAPPRRSLPPARPPRQVPWPRKSAITEPMSGRAPPRPPPLPGNRAGRPGAHAPERPPAPLAQTRRHPAVHSSASGARIGARRRQRPRRADSEAPDPDTRALRARRSVRCVSRKRS